MNTMPMPRSRFSPASSSSTCACTVTSSAVVGSSAIKRRGSLATAIAIIARCRMPPDSSNGKARARRAGSGMPTWRNSSTTRRPAAADDIRRCARSASAICRPTRCTGLRLLRGSWNTIATRSPRSRRRRAPGSRSRSVPSNRTAPADDPRHRRQQAHDREAQQRLAGAALADDRQRLAGPRPKRHVAHRLDRPGRRVDLDRQPIAPSSTRPGWPAAARAPARPASGASPRRGAPVRVDGVTQRVAQRRSSPGSSASSARHGHSSSSGACAMVARAARDHQPPATPPAAPRRGRGTTSPLSSTTAEAAARLTCTSTGPAMLGRTVRAHDARRPGAQHAHRLHVVLRPHREHAGIGDADEPRQVEQRQHRDQRRRARAQQGHHQQRQQQRREAQHDVHAAHRQQLDDTAQEPAEPCPAAVPSTQATAADATARRASDTRAPHSSRDSTSRPYSSWPSQCAGPTAPPDGARRPCGPGPARAAAAPRAPAARARPTRRPAGAGHGASCAPHPRVEHRVEQVDARGSG